jgi:hypothetical protein
LYGFIPVEKGNDWRKEGTSISYSYSDDYIRDVSLADEDIEVIGFDKDKTGFQYLDIKYKGNTSKMLFYVYDKDNKPVIDRFYSQIFGGTVHDTKKVLYFPLSVSDFCYRDLYIDGSMSNQINVGLDRLEGFDGENIKTVDFSIKDIAQRYIRIGDFDKIYTIKDSFSVGGVNYDSNTYVAFYDSSGK